jgi:hypothetical protein
MAAAEAALAERLIELQLQIVERALVLVNNPANSLKMARAAKELHAVHSSIGNRIQSFLTTASILGSHREPARARSHLHAA